MAEPDKLPKYQAASVLFDQWREDVTSGKRPELFPVGKGDLASIQVGPGRVVLLGGAPNAGKSALACQWVFDALRLTPTLKAVIANVEMSPEKLLERQLARVAKVPLTHVHNRTFSADERGKVDAGFAKLRPLLDRLTFVNPPYTLANAALAADAVGAGLILLDYVQRFTVGVGPIQKEKRAEVSDTMGMVRLMADRGKAIVCVAAVGRSKDTKGRNTYDGQTLSLGSFRESSELEYGADDAFILCPAPTDGEPVTLRHMKSRYGECKDIPLTFTKPFQDFRPFDPTK